MPCGRGELTPGRTGAELARTLGDRSETAVQELGGRWRRLALDDLEHTPRGCSMVGLFFVI